MQSTSIIKIELLIIIRIIILQIIQLNRLQFKFKAKITYYCNFYI